MNTVPALTDETFEAYELLSVPVWVFERDSFRILAVNQAALSWLGYDRETLLRMTSLDIRPATERARFLGRVRRFEGKSVDAGIWTIVASSGAQFRVEFGWTKVLFDGRDAIVASIRDMTQILNEQDNTRTLNSSLASLRARMQAHQEHFRRLFEAVPGKMLVISPQNHVIVGVTDEYARAVSRSREDLVGKPLFEAFPDDPSEPDADGTRNLRISLNRVSTLKVTDVMNIQRYPVPMPDGSFEERFWLVLNKPVLGDADDLLYIIHRVEDVTNLIHANGLNLTGPVGQSFVQDDAVRGVVRTGHTGSAGTFVELADALAALQEREARLRTAESLLEIGAWEFDLLTEQFSWSPRVFEIYGLSLEQLPTNLNGYVAIVHPDEREQMLARYRQFETARAPTLVFEHRVMRADGTVGYVRGVGARYQIEGREIVLGYVQDVSGIKQTERQLLEAARLQKRAGYMARLGTWRVELNPPRIIWSDETAVMHDEPEGTSPALEDGIKYYAPEYQDYVRTMVDACLTQGKPFDEVLQLVTAKGRRIWVRAIGEPVYGSQGQVIAAEGAF